MKASQPPDFKIENFPGMAQAHVQFRLLWAGDKFRLFNLLSDQPGLCQQEIYVSKK